MSSLGDRLSAARKAAETDEIDLDDEAYAGQQDLIEAVAEARAGEAEAKAETEPAASSFTPRHAGSGDAPAPPKAAPRPETGGGRRALPISAQDRLEELKQTVHAELLKQL